MTIEKSYAISAFEVHSVEDTFPKCVKQFKDAGLEWITARGAVQLMDHASCERMEFPFILAEAVVAFPGGRIVVTDGIHSPLLSSPQEAFKAHSRNRPFYLSSKQEKEFLKKYRVDVAKGWVDEHDLCPIARFLFREFTDRLKRLRPEKTAYINLTSVRSAAENAKRPVVEPLWYNNGEVYSGRVADPACPSKPMTAYALNRAKSGFEEAIAMAAGQIDKGEPFATKEYTFAPVRRSGIRTVEY